MHKITTLCIIYIRNVSVDKKNWPGYHGARHCNGWNKKLLTRHISTYLRELTHEGFCILNVNMRYTPFAACYNVFVRS